MQCNYLVSLIGAECLMLFLIIFEETFFAKFENNLYIVYI